MPELLYDVTRWTLREWYPVPCFQCWRLCSRIITEWEGLRRGGFRCYGCLLYEDIYGSS